MAGAPSTPRGVPPRTPRGTAGKKKSLQSGSSKTTRLKVGIRCRPPFQDEIEFAEQSGDDFGNIIEMEDDVEVISSKGTGPLSLVSITLLSGKKRDFHFDYCTRCFQASVSV